MTHISNFLKNLAQNIGCNALLAISAVMLCSCSQPNIENIYGRYKLGGPNGQEYLTLNKDGTYFQEYQSKDGVVHLTQTQRWTYEPQKWEVNLQDPLLIYDTTGKPSDLSQFQKKGLWGLVVGQDWGKVRIYINEDSGIGFTKQ